MAVSSVDLSNFMPMTPLGNFVTKSPKQVEQADPYPKI
jgi:hypothetical protein